MKPTDNAQTESTAQHQMVADQILDRQKPGTEIKRTFVWLKHAWYRDATMKVRNDIDLVDEICIQIGDGIGCLDEFRLAWYHLQLHEGPCIRLEVFGDALDALRENRDILEALQDGIQPAELAAALKALGLEDITSIKDPNEEAPDA